MLCGEGAPGRAVLSRTTIELWVRAGSDANARNEVLQRWRPDPLHELVPPLQLVHLLERRHNNRFLALMDKHLPLWRQLRDELNSAPLAHASWSY